MLMLTMFVGMAKADFSQTWASSDNWGNDVTKPEDMTTSFSSLKMRSTIVKVEADGNVTVSFTYTGGSCALNIEGVELVNKTGVAYNVYGSKHAGGDRVAEVFTLENVAAGYYHLRYIVGYDSNNRLNDSNGNIAVTGANTVDLPFDESKFYQLKNVTTNRYLQVMTRGSIAEGAMMIQNKMNSVDQMFIMEFALEDNKYYLKAATGEYINVASWNVGATADANTVWTLSTVEGEDDVYRLSQDVFTTGGNYLGADDDENFGSTNSQWKAYSNKGTADTNNSKWMFEEAALETEPLTEDFYYVIKNKQHNTAMKDISGKAGVATTVDNTDNSQLWALVAVDNKYKLKNKATGNYLEYTSRGNTCWNVNTTGSEFFVGIQTESAGLTPAYYYISNVEITNPSVASRTCAHDAGWGNNYGYKQIVTWDNTADASQWEFIKTTTEVEKIALFTVIYKFMYNGAVVATQETKVEEGETYPAINVQAPYGVTLVADDLAFMSGTVTGDETIEIGLEVTKELPFETAASANDITTWYLVRMHTNQPGYIGDIAEDNTVNVAKGKSSDVANENYIWGFVGDVFSGITVVNKGTGKKLTSTGSGNVTLTDEGTPFFIAETSETTANATNGFCLRKNDSDQYLNANHTAGKLSHWGSTDAGSTFFLSEYEEANVTVSDANWATMYLGYAVYVPEGVNAYTISGVENGYVTKVAVEGVIPANTGVLLENAGDFTFKKAAKDAAAIAGNLMNGSVEDTYVEGTAYVLANHKEAGVGLYKAELNKDAEGNEGTTHFLNNAGKAYMVLPAASETVAFYGLDWDGTTGINEVKGENGNVKAIFDLTGRRVENISAPGIYIVGGKKVLVK